MLNIRYVALLALAASTAVAQVRTADVPKRGLKLTDFPRFVKLADNVYGYEEIRQPGMTTVSLVVIGKNGVLLADGQGNAAATQKMLDGIKTLTPLPLKWYVVGSDHGDHTGGNSVLPKGVQTIVSSTSRRIMALDTLSRDWTPIAPGMPRILSLPPVSMVGDEEVIDVGGTKVHALFLGRAHTGGDLMVHLPAQKILFMSEAYLNRVFPAMRSAYPNEWVATVDRALALDNVTRFVPGHGFIEEPAVSREELVAFRGALVAVIAEVERLHALGLTQADAVAKANWGQYADWFIREQQAPIAIRKVYEQIEGRLP
jgi:cyclase